MPSEAPRRLQDTFLDHLQGKKIPVTVFLINGVKLQGTVASHDAFCILLARDGQSQAIYKQAVSTIAPGYPIDLWGDGDKEQAQATSPRRERTVVVERRPISRRPTHER